MTAPTFRVTLSLLAAIVCSLGISSFGLRATADEPRKPDVVIFLADDLGWWDCSIHGQADIRTPNMERVAAEGMKFSHAFVASPSCAPSRGALLTGLNPPRNGALFNHTVPDEKHKRWPAYFQEAGYEVVAIGKVAHYATVQQYGFDQASHFKYHQDDCVEAAVDWLDRRESDKPLCLMVGTNWPHVPWPEESDYSPDSLPLPPTQVDHPVMREWRARYAAAVAKADRDLGIVYDAAYAKLGPSTLFLYSSDHGAQFPFGKWNCYDAGLRTPLLAVWPGKIAAGSETAAMVSWIDILPTCLDAVGAEPPASGQKEGEIDGESFLPVLLGDATDHRDSVFATHSGDGRMNEFPMRSLRTRDWKYVRNLTSDAEHHTHVDQAQGGLGKGYWHAWESAAKTDPRAAALVERYYKRPAEELYDLAADPWEMHNLAEDPAHAERLASMQAKLDAVMAEQGDAGLATEDAHRPRPKK